MPSSSFRRRLLYLLAIIAPLWALIVHVTGGVGWAIGPVRVSSREPFRPLVVGLVFAAYYAWRYLREEREADARWIQRGLDRISRFGLPVLLILGLAGGLYFGSYAAAGSDSYGYVSQARLWLTGTLWVEQPWVQQFSWPNRDWAFTPLGYRPMSNDGVLVPNYPPGLPMLMAVFLGLFGENGPFFVVPLLGAVMLWLTVLLGRETTGSNAVGLLAGFMLLVSPTFLAHLMLPMSDVPAAAAWTLVCLLALKQRELSTGLAASAALLIRPNLIALALMPVVAWRGRREPLKRYALGVLPGVLFIAVLNVQLYGGPLISGYGPFFESYAVSGGPANLHNYLGWLIQTQTPLILLACVPAFVKGALSDDRDGVSPRDGLVALVLLTFASYVFYGVFDHWYYLRFLLPAYGAIFVLTAAAIRWLALKLPLEAQAPVTAFACGLIMSVGLNVGTETGIFNQAQFEQRYVRAAADVARRTTPKAVVLAVQHSGSVRYYANRITLRYDWVANDALDATIHDLIAAGYQPYLVLEDWEESEFRTRFGPHSRFGKLDWAPLARVPGSPEVRIYAINE